MRGDHRTRRDHVRVADGLPPRARGSLHARDAYDVEAGPTPACARITFGSAHPRSPPLAYPRVRGDHKRRGEEHPAARGLPPRARGSLTLRPATPLGGGPTPACAGITNCRIESAYADEAYPRVRGDHLTGLRLKSASNGLPPRARGSLPHAARSNASPRPTPACAGITTPLGKSSGVTRAYPRVRGDHATRVFRLVAANGLPPRARGSQVRAPLEESTRWPTPACAGITVRRSD